MRLAAGLLLMTLALALIVIYLMIISDWIQRGYYLVVYMNYFLFFGTEHLYQIKTWLRRRNWRA